MVLGLTTITAAISHGFELITAAEAGIPDEEVRSRGIFLGPRILVLDPPPKAGFIKSPFTLRVRFEARGGGGIDPDSILVTYRKRKAIDLTQRIRPYIIRDGILLEGARVPAGEHRIRIDVRDTDGRQGSTEFTIRVSD
ncbi:MAG: hypothetical protein IT536_01315 [Hyphomicrobiales bacterium]|nr:hypothetical protein [Hyphomicrobiales bacterium]